ncbi:hypothetical protein PVAP13_4KG361205 [Panicum virgatum]|uniref:Uncharacterized protein n=1 Tax=Panicum virgatum TaxID=38727 RepID=A0A8T0TQY2_PANVG|nr:hypothetical protein PVAP13_4KG361205 [Panicum virgatum]
MYAAPEGPSVAQTAVGRRHREPAMTVQQGVPVPAIGKAESGWIGPASPNTDRLDQIIQKYQKHADSHGSVVEVVREIKAAMDRDKKLFEELKEEVEALTVELDSFKKQQQEQEVGRVISGVLSFFPVSEAIKSMLADLLTHILVRSCRDTGASG